jgi:catechol-2,3-dioxygenase
VFDAEVKHENPALAFLTYDDEHHRFAFENLDVLRPAGEETKKEGLIGVDHLAYTYSSIDDLLDSCEQLKSHGITPYWCVHHGGTVAMYYADPDNREDWLAQKRAGVRLSSFLARSTDEPVSPIREALG